MKNGQGETMEEEKATNTCCAKEYSRKKVWLTFIGFGLTCLILAVMVATGFAGALRTYVSGFVASPWLVVGGFFLFFSLCVYILEFPLHWYGAFALEHQYHLSNQTFLQWLWEDSKKQWLSFGVGIVLVELLYLCIRCYPQTWWVYVWGIWILFSVVFGKLFPVFIVPLFYKYSTVPDTALRDRLRAFVDAFGMRVKDVYSIDLSKTTKKANACFCGLGKTKRVILADTLLNAFTPDEIESVLAHEIGHYRKKHIVKNIVVSCVVSLVTFYVLYYLLQRLVPVLHYTAESDVATLPLLMLLASIMGFFMMPLQNMLSRRMENEADDFAIDTTKNKNAFFSAMDRLADMNLADRTPHPAIEFLLYSHPSISKRIARQRARCAKEAS